MSDDLPPGPRHRGAIHKLTPKKVQDWYRNAEPPVSGRAWSISDGGGLRLQRASRHGVATWYQDVSIRGAGKEGKAARKDYRCGNYPPMTPEEARKRGERAKGLAAQGLDPLARDQKLLQEAQHKRETRDKLGLCALIAEMVAKDEQSELSRPSTLKPRLSRMNRFLRPVGDVPIDELKIREVMPIIEAVAERTPETALRLCNDVRMAAEYALQEGYIEVKAAVAELKPPISVRAYQQEVNRDLHHRPALLDFEDLGGVLIDNDNCGSMQAVKDATFFCIHVPCRSGRTVEARWDEMDLDRGIWTVPRNKMKVKRAPKTRRSVRSGERTPAGGEALPFVMPLPPRIVEWLREMPRVGPYVFPGQKDINKHIAQGTLEAHFQVRLGLDGVHSPNSCRASLDTWASAQKDPNSPRELYSGEAIDFLLDHRKDKVSRAYLFDVILPLMRPIEEAWSDQVAAGMSAAKATRAKETERERSERLAAAAAAKQRALARRAAHRTGPARGHDGDAAA